MENFLTVDPGVGGTGLALWGAYPRKGPRVTLCITPETKGSWELRAQQVVLQYGEFLKKYHPDSTYIEEPSVWMTPKGLASAGRGDVGKLIEIVGMLSVMTYIYCEQWPIKVPVVKWKGQLPKNIVDRRIKRILGKTYNEHVSDAVGMGLFLQGYFQ